MAILGAGKTGLTGTMGYRILDHNGDIHIAFTTTNVAEAGTPGTYFVDGGVTLDTTFVGREVWGTLGVDMGEGPILSQPASVSISGSGANLCTFTVQDNLANLVSGAVVYIYDSAGSTLVAVCVPTNGSGVTTANLTAGTYKVRVLSTSQYIALAQQTLTVDGTEAVTYTLTRYAPTEPSAASVCRVYGWLKYADGTALKSVGVTFKPRAVKPTVASGSLIGVDETLTATTDSGGYFQIDLIYSSALDPNEGYETGEYRVRCPEIGLDAYITVPDESTKDLRLLL